MRLCVRVRVRALRCMKYSHQRLYWHRVTESRISFSVQQSGLLSESVNRSIGDLSPAPSVCSWNDSPIGTSESIPLKENQNHEVRVALDLSAAQ